MSNADIIVIAALVYLYFGFVCAVWRAKHGRTLHDDAVYMLIVVLWPVWLLAYAAYREGWDNR